MNNAYYVEETLYHFNCENCHGYWSQSDSNIVVGEVIFCPHCGERLMTNRKDDITPLDTAD